MDILIDKPQLHFLIEDNTDMLRADIRGKEIQIYDRYGFSAPSSGNWIASLPTLTVGEGNATHYAKLFVAAPDMLEALQALRGMEAWINDPEIKELFRRTVYSAINKATK